METIPQPKTFGPLGNLPLLDLERPVQSLVKLAQEHGPIYRMDLPGRSDLIISSYELVSDACDEQRFDKKVWAPLQKVRAFAGDGLFTSWTEEPNWRKAHHILLPSFSQTAMRGYQDMMVDIAVQLVQKWARLNPDDHVDVPEDMTRLTLDTIGLCGFNYRFNSFYREEPHPFITSMVRALGEAMSQLQRLGIQDKLMIRTKRQFQRDIETMFSLVDKIIAERKSHGQLGGDDLLAHMLSGKDPETGEALDDENIRYQIITFLIAGHETTSGLLSFALYFLMKNPDKLRKAYEEVDRVLTDPVPSYRQVRELKYIQMVLNEALRLWPTAPAFSLYAKEDTVLAGKYPMQKGESVNVLIPQLHRDPAVWGEDAESFLPERFEDPSAIPYHAFKPFGNGQRACIGQQFALQEATLVLGMVLKHFELIDHAGYELKVKESLTLKPDGFKIQVRPRGSRTAFNFVPANAGSSANAAVAFAEEADKSKKTEAKAPLEDHRTPLLVLYGSNMGTAEGLARELAETARTHGFQSRVAPLNDHAGSLPKEGAVLIVSASYNGKPPSNARTFVQRLGQLQPEELSGVQYAVFGCGDRNWASTYQYIPRLIDEQLSAYGAARITARGEADASGDFEKQIEDWQLRLWPDLMSALHLKSPAQPKQERGSLQVKFVQGHTLTPLAKSYGAAAAIVTANRELQAQGSGRSTRHLELALPEGVTYKEGDHLGVLPMNAPALVDRVLRRYGLHGTDQLILSGSGSSAAHLPLERPVSVQELLGGSVELQEAATRAQLRELAAHTVCPPHQKELEALLQEEVYAEKVLAVRLTMLDLLERYPACELPFPRFIELLPPLKPRYYSISSSPKAQAGTASITVGVVRSPAHSGRGEYLGVASNYLAGCREGEAVPAFVSAPDSGFQLPDNPETPIIMIGPGTGVAPFRGFLQARSAMKREGRVLGEAHLFYGCRDESDYLYREEMEQFEREGLVRLHVAYSRKDGTPKTYVQHLLRQPAGEVLNVLERGGKLYVCGDGSRMAPEAEQTLVQMYREKHGVAEQEAAAWLTKLEAEGRYAKDVWSGA